MYRYHAFSTVQCTVGVLYMQVVKEKWRPCCQWKLSEWIPRFIAADVNKGGRLGWNSSIATCGVPMIHWVGGLTIGSSTGQTWSEMGRFLKWGIPKAMAFNAKIIYFWMICGYSHFGTRPNRTSFLLHSRAVPIFPAGQQPTTALRRRGDMLQRLCNDHLGLRVDARRWIFVQMVMDMDSISWSFIGRCLACWLGISNMTISPRRLKNHDGWKLLLVAPILMMELRSQDELVAFGDNFNDIEMILAGIWFPCWVPWAMSQIRLVLLAHGTESPQLISYLWSTFPLQPTDWGWPWLVRVLQCKMPGMSWRRHLSRRRWLVHPRVEVIVIHVIFSWF